MILSTRCARYDLWRRDLHWRMSKSILINIFILILLRRDDFTKSINSDQLLKVLVKRAFATVLIRELYSYEVDVKNLNCWLFEIIISWLEIWDETVLNSTKTLLWSDFSIAISHVKLFATTLVIISAKFVVKSSLLLLLVVYWDFCYAMWICSKMINSLNCCSSFEINFFLMKQYEISCNSNTILLAAFAILILIERSYF